MRKVVKISLYLIFLVSIIYINCDIVFASESNTILKDTILKNDVVEYNDESKIDQLYYLEKENDKIYFYAGNIKNNNVVFNSLKFNIIGIDLNGNIKIMYNQDDIKATSSNYREVLNNWYKEKFDKSDTKNIITKTQTCDTLNNNLFCDNIVEEDVALISLQEYKHSKINNETFLNKEYNYYFWTTYYNHKYYFDAINDEIHTTKLKEFNIYPVITLSSKTMIGSGDGTETSPFVIANTIYGNSENTIKEDRKVKLDNPKIIKKDDIDLLIKDNNLNSITYEIYNNNEMVYSIKFLKEELKSVSEFNLNIIFNELDDSISKNVRKILKDKKYKYFTIENTKEFPSTAITSINTKDMFNEEDTLWLYYYNEEENKLEYVDNNLLVEDDLVTLNINKGGKYILSLDEIVNLKDTVNTKKYILFSISILSVIGIFSIILIKKYKKN